jgi:glycosyltransferase involved in cell wall biosynthesis
MGDVRTTLRIALLGTRGVPARYGGFETAVEEIGAGLVERGHEVVVYCREAYDGGETYRGMRRVVLPALRRKALETLTHTGLSSLHCLRHRPDAALVFNAANAPYIAVLRAARIPTALHIDGHDARRAKWRGIGAWYYRAATRWGSAVANEVVVDSRAIQAELHDEGGIDARFIAYGAPDPAVGDRQAAALMAPLGLEPGGYHLVVARFEPENQLLEIVEGYAVTASEQPLVVVGFAGYPGDYARAITEAAARDPRVRLLGAVWDQDLLDALYAGAATYIHGHSVGGTNPSLLRAMAQCTPVIAYDCPYNRETTGGAALFFSGAQDVADQLKTAEVESHRMWRLAAELGGRAREHYRWPAVTDAFEDLLLELASGRRSHNDQGTAQLTR